jgi:hypothetical protein
MTCTFSTFILHHQHLISDSPEPPIALRIRSAHSPPRLSIAPDSFARARRHGHGHARPHLCPCIPLTPFPFPFVFLVQSHPPSVSCSSRRKEKRTRILKRWVWALAGVWCGVGVCNAIGPGRNRDTSIDQGSRTNGTHGTDGRRRSEQWTKPLHPPRVESSRRGTVRQRRGPGRRYVEIDRVWLSGIRSAWVRKHDTLKQKREKPNRNREEKMRYPRSTDQQSDDSKIRRCDGNLQDCSSGFSNRRKTHNPP